MIKSVEIIKILPIMKKIVYFTPLLILLSYSPAFATLGRFRDIALENRKEVEISERQVELTRWRSLNAARNLGPYLTLEYKSTEGETIDDPYRAESYGLRFEQSIFHGGGKLYTYRRERTAHRVSRESRRRVEEDIKFEVAEAYYRVIMNMSMLDSYRRLLEQVEKEYSLARRQYDREIKTELDYREIANLRESILVNKEIVKDNLKVSRRTLRNICGVDEIPDIDETGLEVTFTRDILPYTLQDCFETALEYKPEIRIAELLVDQSDYDLRASKAANVPGVTLEGFAGRSGEAYVDQDLVLADQWSVFLNLNWAFWGNTFNYKYGESRTSPSEILDVSVRTETSEHTVQFSLLDGIGRVYSDREKEITMIQAENDLRRTRDEVLREVKRNYQMLSRVMELIEVDRKRLEVARGRAEVINKRRLLGEATIREVMDAHHNMAGVRNSMYENIYNLFTAAAGLNKSCGRTLIPLEALR